MGVLLHIGFVFKMEASSVASGRAVMAEFIEKYKNAECLWRVTDKNYKNRQYRQKALEDLLPILKKIDSTTNLDSITKKINSMRSAFNKEHNKVKVASRSGIGADEEYIPKLWYYDLLLFLNEREAEVGRSCDINAILNEENDENKDQDMDMSLDQATKLSAQSEPPPRSATNSNNSKKKQRDGVCEVLTKISKRLDSSTIKTKLTFSAFGEHVAEKLRTMSSDSAKYCQKIINDAIFYGEFDDLNHTSRIVTDHRHADRSRLRSQTLSPYYRPYRSPSTQSQSPNQSPNEQLERPLRPPSTQTQSPYQSPIDQLDRPLRPPFTQIQSPYQSPNDQLDRPLRPPFTQIQSPYQAPNEQLDRPLRPPFTQIPSPYQSPNEQLDRPLRPPFTQIPSPYQSPNEQLDRPLRPPFTQIPSPYQSPNEQLDRPLRPPSTQTQSPYQSPNEQLDRPLQPPSVQSHSSHKSPNPQLNRPYRPPSTQTQSPYQSSNVQLNRPLVPQPQSQAQAQSSYMSPYPQLNRPYQTELSQSILIELPYQPQEQPLQQSSASNAVIANNADEIVDYLDQQDYDNSLSSPIVAEGDVNSMKNYLIFKPRAGD